MPNDRHLQSITIGIFVFMSLVSLAMIRNDMTDISDPTLCSIIIVFRILFSGFILASCVIYIKSGRSRLFSNLVQLIISMTALISGVITWTRPPDSSVSFYITTLVIIAAWAVPTRGILSRAMPLLALLANDVTALLVQRSLESRTTLTIIVTLVSSNLIGLWIAWRLGSLRALEQKLIDTHRREAEFRRMIADVLLDGVIVSRNRIIIDCNQTLCQMLDRKKNDLCGEEVQSILTSHPDDGEAVFDNMENRPRMMTLRSSIGDLPVEVSHRSVEIEGKPHLITIVRDQSINLAMDEQRGWIESQVGLNQNLTDRVEQLPISKREKEVVNLVLAGKNRSDIAEALFISDETVKQHLTNIYRKLEIRGKSGLFSLVYGPHEKTP